MKWIAGVITAPREQESYIAHSVESLTKAGFGDLVVFAEPGSFIPQSFKGHVVHRPKRYGDWTNWATALYELLLSNPDTDYFLMCEDDAVVCHGCKAYLEYTIPQLGEFGSISLYTPSIYSRKRFRGFHNELQGHRTWSTVTVIMSRDKVIQFFSDPQVQLHRFENTFDKPDGYWRCEKTDPKNSLKDAVIGRWASSIGLPIYYHTPSLAEHIGNHSTLTDRESTIDNGRRSRDFVGLEYDLTPWLSEPVNVRKHTSVMLT